MNVSIVSIRNADAIVGLLHLRIGLVWFRTGRTINKSFTGIVDHLAVEVVEAYAYDIRKLKQARDNHAAILKASHAHYAAIIGRHIFPATQADTTPADPSSLKSAPPVTWSLWTRAWMATIGDPRIISLTIISVLAIQVGAANTNMQLGAMVQKWRK